MRTAAQDVQVIEAGDNIEALEEALFEAEKAYTAARKDKVPADEEEKLKTAIEALRTEFDTQHGLADLAAEIMRAEAALEAIYPTFNEDEDDEEGVPF